MNMTVNCQWSSWNSGSCSKTCGGGSITKIRTKTVQEANGGSCQGQSSRIENCNSNLCPGTSIFTL